MKPGDKYINNKLFFIQHILRELDAGTKHNKKSIEKICSYVQDYRQDTGKGVY